MKRILILIVTALMAINVFSQTEIDEWVKKGMNDYNQEKYQEAIQYFEKVKEALDKQEQKQNDEHYGDLLFLLANCYFEIGDFSKAVEYGTKVVEITKATLGENHPDYATSLSFLASYHARLGDYSKAVEYETKAMEIRKTTLGEDHIHYASSMNNLCDFYCELGEYEKAIPYGIKAMEIYKATLGKEDPHYALSLGTLARNYAAIGNYSTAVEYATKAMEIFKSALGEDHPNYAASIANLAGYYADLGNYSMAIELGTKSLVITKTNLGENHPDYAQALNNLSLYYSELADYAKAVEYETKALEIDKTTLGENHPHYAASLDNLASLYSSLGDYSKTVEYGTKALEIRKTIYGENHPDYALSLNNLASYYSELGDYSKAVEYGTKATEIRKTIYGENHPDYAASLDNLGGYFLDLGDYAKAVEYGTKAMEIRKAVYGEKHPDYALSLNNLAGRFFSVGDYSKAVEYGTKAVETSKAALGENHPTYAKALDNLAGYYSAIGDFSRAVLYGTKAMEIRKKMLGEKHPDYALSLGNLANYYYNLGDYSKAVLYGTKAMEIDKATLGESHPSYATSLGNLANYYSRLGDHSEAIKYGTKALEIRKAVLGEKHPDCATILSNLASFYSSLGVYSKAVEYGTKALEIRKDVLGENHPDYALSLNNLASYHNDHGDYPKAYEVLKQSLDISQKRILDVFSGLSPGLREALWKKEYAFPFNSYFPSVVFKNQTEKSISELYDKTALFSKGILLNSSVGMRQLILESSNPVLISKYDALTTNINIYDKLLEKQILKRYLNLDSLQNVIQQQEMELARESKAYGDFARNIRINWKDVQKKLGQDAIAIEFLDFPIINSDSTMFVALTLKKEYESPHITALFEKEQLNSIPRNSYYTSSRIYNLIWKPLEKELIGVKDVYFAPSGELHRIAIEYVPMTSTENICDKYSLHRLSSTRQLAFIQDETKGEKTILYGGLEYDASPSSTASGTDRSFRYILHTNVDSLSLRGSYDYLPGTREETDLIAADLDKYSIPYSYFYGKDGTEETFKGLDGSKPRMLHIATHGFYMTQQDAIRNNAIMQNEDLTNHEDMPMTRSGLLLSGCSPALNHKTIQEGAEDGILTAQEISKLDLRGLDLVVLSACQTGLGDIESGEGVFGLQRGFKNAGARTIVMSLWKVNDNATQMMMTQFYKNLCNGMDKHEALHAAQKHLREYKNEEGENIFDNPHFWAGFIILD